MGRDHFRSGSREMLRRETAIEADHDAAIGAAVLHHPLGDGLRAHADSVERVLVSNAGSPAIGPKDDVHRYGGWGA